ETRNLRFLTTVYVLPMRDPFSVAKSISTAAYMSDDRLVLGVGVGWQKTEFELTGQNYHTRGKRCDEQLKVIELLTSGRMVEFHGEFYDFPPLMMSPGTHKPVPVFIGGHSKAAFRRAVKHNGWLGLRYQPDEIPAIIASLKAARNASNEVLKCSEREFDIWLAPLVQEESVYNEIEAMGVTMVNGANFFVDGKVVPTTLDFKKQRMENFANRFLK
ncbi:MAG: LLM class flavin-dependent oxidoreductase, partial [Pseudomonadales bacterium]|nr:LLM class flavin-dependent oxidoreductase [Pseudomonadales bacterium]